MKQVVWDLMLAVTLEYPPLKGVALWTELLDAFHCHLRWHKCEIISVSHLPKNLNTVDCRAIEPETC